MINAVFLTAILKGGNHVSRTHQWPYIITAFNQPTHSKTTIFISSLLQRHKSREASKKFPNQVAKCEWPRLYTAKVQFNQLVFGRTCKMIEVDKLTEEFAMECCARYRHLKFNHHHQLPPSSMYYLYRPSADTDSSLCLNWSVVEWFSQLTITWIIY